ncbi:MAG: hypothetical protein AB8C95_04140 [Phycisphaeraceae bacterium]
MATTTASADDFTGGYTEDDGWSGWGEWECENWGWDRDNEWQGEACNDHPGGPGTPTGVPSPTAAIAGLGVMGLMLSRRRNKKA